MALKLYGRKSSLNVQKVIWCLNELGLQPGKDYTRIDAGLHFGVNKTPAFLQLNPNALVPTFQDGDFAVWESNTIMRYLGRKFDGAGRIFPNDLKSQTVSDQWLDWQLTLWSQLRVPFLGLTRIPEKERNYDAIRQNFKIGGFQWCTLIPSLFASFLLRFLPSGPFARHTTIAA